MQTYLRGEEIPFEELNFGETLAPLVDELELADTAGTSQEYLGSRVCGQGSRRGIGDWSQSHWRC